MRTSFARFVKDESGATAIEYGLIAAGIAVAIITAVNAIGTDLSGLFGRVSAKLNAAGTSKPAKIDGSSSAANAGLDPIFVTIPARSIVSCASPQSSIIRA